MGPALADLGAQAEPPAHLDHKPTARRNSSTARRLTNCLVIDSLAGGAAALAGWLRTYHQQRIHTVLGAEPPISRIAIIIAAGHW
jgi:hypothetical protein